MTQLQKMVWANIYARVYMAQTDGTPMERSDREAARYDAFDAAQEALDELESYRHSVPDYYDDDRRRTLMHLFND